MIQTLLYNDLFPLRLVNFINKYLEAGGTIQCGHRVISQLSKLEIIDFFFPSLFIKTAPPTVEEAEYNYEICYIIAPRKQGIFSNWGSYKQKINNIEDCLLGNSRSEKTYKNYTVTQNMLKRAASDLLEKEDLFFSTFSNLQSIYTDHLSKNQQQAINAWIDQMLIRCAKEETLRVCTSGRRDGFSFDPDVYNSLIRTASFFCKRNEYRKGWSWLCIGSLMGNYSGQLIKKYSPADHEKKTGRNKPDAVTYRLISSIPEITNPLFIDFHHYTEQISQLFSSGNHVIFLCGIAGIGKTEIANNYAFTYRDQYDVIIRCHYGGSLKKLITADTLFETVPQIYQFNDSETKESDDDYFLRKLNIIKKASSDRTLIIIDDFNTEKDEAFSYIVKGRYKLLFISQYDNSRDYPCLQIKEPDDMQTLISLFMNHYGGYSVDKDDPDLAELIRFMNCHTYSVILLARHMENSGQTPSEMLDSLRKNGITAFNEKISMPHFPTEEAYLNLVRMFSIDDLCDEEKRVLQILSVMPEEGIPPMEFKNHACLSSTRTLVKLEKRGWIIRTGKGIALHPVVRLVIRHLLPAESDLIQLSS